MNVHVHAIIVSTFEYLVTSSFLLNMKESEEEMDPVQLCLEEIKKDFKIYNREK